MNMTSTIQNNDITKKLKSVMVVDNTPLILSILGSMIVGGGYSFNYTKSSQNALGSIEASQPDLIILRADKPDIDGFELAKKLNEDGSKIPMIFLSDEVTKESVVKAYQMGAKDFITWPSDKKTILDKITKQLQS